MKLYRATYEIEVYFVTEADTYDDLKVKDYLEEELRWNSIDPYDISISPERKVPKEWQEALLFGTDLTGKEVQEKLDGNQSK